MDFKLYCQPQNLIPFSQFIEDIKDKQFIYIGEDHLNPIHRENERKILEALFNTGKKFNLATEHLDRNTYQTKTEMLSKFQFESITTLTPPNSLMLNSLRNLRNQSTMIIVGNRHLYGPNTIDQSMKREFPDLESRTILQESFSVEPAIYIAKTIDHNQKYIIIGRLN